MPNMMALQVPFRAPERVSESMARMVKTSPELMAGIRRGLADRKAGRVRPWKDIRRELGLG